MGPIDVPKKNPFPFLSGVTNHQCLASRCVCVCVGMPGKGLVVDLSGIEKGKSWRSSGREKMTLSSLQLLSSERSLAKRLTTIINNESLLVIGVVYFFV